MTRTTEEKFVEALHMTSHSWGIALDRRLRPLGFSRSKWLIFLHLSREDGLTHSALAERIGIEPATLVRLIDKMEIEGVVMRKASEIDRRIKHLHLTPTGIETAKRVKAQAIDLRKKLLSEIDPQQLEITLNTLSLIRKKLESTP
jgi:MarR family transcriptional regulator for hemolysin